MGASQSSQPKKTVIIVGGGFGGINLAKRLDAHVTVILVNASDKMHLNMASPRSLVDRGFAAKTFYSYDKLLKHGRFVHGTATAIEPRIVMVAKADGSGNEVVTGDYVVIATGALFQAPLKQPLGGWSADALAALHAAQASVAAASKIVVVGGGPLGVEIAAEIAQDFPSKSVTLVHSDAVLLDNSSGHLAHKAAAKLAQRTAKKLTEMGVELMLGSRAARPDTLKAGSSLGVGATTVTTEGGASIEADLVIWTATPAIPNSAPLRAHLAGALDAAGRIRVSPTLEVEGHPGLFAIGDIKTQAGAKKADAYLGFPAMVQAKHVAKSIRGMLRGKPAAIYAGSPPALVMSLGRKRGVGSFGGVPLGDMIVGSLKSKLMFTNLVDGLMGVKA